MYVDMASYRAKPLPRDFFARPTLDVARELIGKIVVCRRPGAAPLAARLVEVEAYLGERDPASHAYKGPRGRAAIMFNAPGKLYVYLSYGMHRCMNVVAHEPGVAGAVLLRAAEPLEGFTNMLANRGVTTASLSPSRVARGPGCLTAALGISLADNFADLIAGPVRIHEASAAVQSPFAQAPFAGGSPAQGLPEKSMVDGHLCTSPRIGISRAADLPWRFHLCGHPARSGPGRFNRCEADPAHSR
jgi:DNA-3-methyladenine glycosylase